MLEPIVAQNVGLAGQHLRHLCGRLRRMLRSRKLPAILSCQKLVYQFLKDYTAYPILYADANEPIIISFDNCTQVLSAISTSVTASMYPD